MASRKKRKKLEKKIAEVKDLNQQIAEIVSGLTYMSETDAEIKAFSGQQTEAVTREELLAQIGKPNDLKVEEKDFNEFFEPLITIEKWFEEEERKMTEKFITLKEFLQKNLRDLKVFRIGKKEIEIYVVGLDQENILRGVQTKAVET